MFFNGLVIVMKNQDGELSITLLLDDEGHFRDRDEKEFEKQLNDFLILWSKFLKAQGENSLVYGKDYFIHKRNVYEILKRLDKRKAYYYVFHKINKICEYKEVAILCYWINTLKPFMVVNEKSKIYSCPNEMLSLYIIMSTIGRIFKEQYPERTFEKLDAKTIQDYVYNFKYCDLSREATIFFVETLAKSYGVGMEIINK